MLDRIVARRRFVIVALTGRGSDARHADEWTAAHDIAVELGQKHGAGNVVVLDLHAGKVMALAAESLVASGLACYRLGCHCTLPSRIRVMHPSAQRSRSSVRTREGTARFVN